MSGDGRLLMNLDAAAVGAAGITPGHGVVAGNGAGRMVQGPADRRLMSAAVRDRFRESASSINSGPTTSLSMPRCLFTSARQRWVRSDAGEWASVKWPRSE